MKLYPLILALCLAAPLAQAKGVPYAVGSLDSAQQVAKKDAYTPVFVFLDASGKKVMESAGFRSAREAKALHAFVAKKEYLKTSWEKFLAAYPR